MDDEERELIEREAIRHEREVIAAWLKQRVAVITRESLGKQHRLVAESLLMVADGIRDGIHHAYAASSGSRS